MPNPHLSLERRLDLLSRAKEQLQDFAKTFHGIKSSFCQSVRTWFGRRERTS